MPTGARSSPAVVDREGGLIERFAGDAVLAVFNALGDQPDHAIRAVRAAMDVRDASERVRRSDAGWPRFRVGVNTGPVVIGNVGAGDQRSLLGDRRRHERRGAAPGASAPGAGDDRGADADRSARGRRRHPGARPRPARPTGQVGGGRGLRAARRDGYPEPVADHEAVADVLAVGLQEVGVALVATHPDSRSADEFAHEPVGARIVGSHPVEGGDAARDRSGRGTPPAAASTRRRTRPGSRAGSRAPPRDRRRAASAISRSVISPSRSAMSSKYPPSHERNHGGDVRADDHDRAAGDSAQLAHTGGGVGPVVDGQHRHRRGERAVAERQALCDTLDRRARRPRAAARSSPPRARPRSTSRSVGLVGPRAGTDVQHGRGVAEHREDSGRRRRARSLWSGCTCAPIVSYLAIHDLTRVGDAWHDRAPCSTLTTRRLNRALLARQGCSAGGASRRSGVVEQLVGMQAQEPRDPYVAAWTRIDGHRPTASGARCWRARPFG